MVFSWHFTHGASGSPVPFEANPALWLAPLALLDEGHTGVALFMTLSGYLFAKLLDGRAVDYLQFFRNRALRLLPLLLLVMLLVGLQQVQRGVPPVDYLRSLLAGLVWPSWPNGGWSITVELHFYLLLPLLLWLGRRWGGALPALLLGALVLRVLLHQRDGEVQWLAYWTLVGRIDQFVAGILAWRWRHVLAGRPLRAALIVGGFVLAYWLFDVRGGFYGMPSYPSPSRWWIVLPALEGIAYAAAIAWYDNSARLGNGRLSRWVARYGEYSYAIYLLHVFVVFDAARWIHLNLMDLSNLYVACLWALPTFMLMGVPAHISWRCVEQPFLRLRRPYLRSATARRSRHV